MSVLIKMEMPTSCKWCRFAIDDECVAVDDQISFPNYSTFPIWCPLIHVPPHGDLIDRDELKEQLEYVASLEWNQRVGASPGIECAIDMLDDAQTIIPSSKEGE